MPRLNFGPAYVSSLEPSLYVAPPELAWYQPASEPTRTLPHRNREGQNVKPLEPSLILSPTPFSWHVLPSVPVLPARRPPETGRFASPLDQPAFSIVTPMPWYVPPSEPVRSQPRLPQHEPHVKPLEPRLIEATPGIAWYQPASEPARALPRLNPQTQFVTTFDSGAIDSPPEMSWQQPASVPARMLPRRADGWAALPAFTEIRFDTWHQPTSTPRPRPFHRPDQSGGTFGLAAELLVVFTVDKWAGLSPMPAPLPRPVNEGGAIGPAIYTILPDIGWHQPASVPVLRLARAAVSDITHLELVLPGDPLNIPRVDWFSQSPGPVRRENARPWQASHSLASVELFGVVTVDKWFSLAQTPAPVKRPVNEGGAVLPAIYSTLADISWHRPLSEPVRLPMRTAAADITHLELVLPGDPLNIPRVDWFSASPIPAPRPMPTRAGGVAYVASEFIFITLDKWHRPASEPIQPTRSPQAGQSVISWDYTTPRNPADWLQPASVPTARPPINPSGLFVGLVEPSLFITPAPLSWFSPPSEPTRTMPRLNTGHAFSFVVFRPVNATKGLMEAGEIWVSQLVAGEVFTPHAEEGQGWTPHLGDMQVE